MKTVLLSLILFLSGPFASATAGTSPDDWSVEHREGYDLHYKSEDAPKKREYIELLDGAHDFVQRYFGREFRTEFDVYVHPGRDSLDASWRKEWKLPDFRSECWMVASGFSARMDILSPRLWEKESCEHDYSDKAKTIKLIRHELFHVFHGQLNASPDFSEIYEIDWFAEGLATAASGQCDSTRVAEVKQAVAENKIPASLNNFWTGNLRYGLSCSVVMYIEGKYGRDKLYELLKFNRKTEILAALATDEDELVKSWKAHISGK